MKRRYDVVVIGAGLAGGAFAWALARRGQSVLVVEREARAGVHASGRNAGLVRRIEASSSVARLSREGASLLADPPQDLAAGPLYRQTGSILIARGPELAVWEAAAADAIEAGVEVERGPAADLAERSGLRSTDGIAFRTPRDGVADPHEVLSAFLASARAQGAEVAFEAPARLNIQGGRVVGVELPSGEVEAEWVVNAAGPWAAELVADAGGLALDLQSYRRHLFYTGPLAGVSPNAPWIWDLERGFYLRPESSGWLLCACDHEPRPPEDTQAATDAGNRLAAKVMALAPDLVDHPIARSWAGLRTFAPDGRFVIGPDPQLSGLFWATGLGGHGLTTSGAVGLLGARVLSGDASRAELAPFDPGRFLTAAAGVGERA
ncbi:MAG: FAD-binding oxidoreductase [Planctomycetes bacterium]|nr:FAD-binding oxidoreductase [Planctomycetota bacterium]